MSDEDSNNSSLNNLFGHFMHFADIGGQEFSLDEDHLVCFDTRNHRIGINTIDPTCSLDIAGLNGKIIVNSISCEKLDVGEIKTLTKDLDNGAKIEFSLEAKTWNEMLIGNSVGVEGGKCKYFEKNYQDERILHFGMLCKSWDVNIEVVFDEYENYEQYNFGIKEFGGYYN